MCSKHNGYPTRSAAETALRSPLWRNCLLIPTCVHYCREHGCWHLSTQVTHRPGPRGRRRR